MTEKLYEADSYVQNFTAQVVSCTSVPSGFAVVLDRTAFFPEGGGQPCDTGRFGGARVLAVHTDGETITHTTDAPLTAGETVDGCLDWPARLDAMQQHTGEHILSGALHRLFGAENVGFHIGSPYVRMDTSIPLTQEQLADESHVSTKQIADIEKARRNPSYLILKALAKVVHLSLDSLMYPDLSPDEAGQNEMKLLYMNCPPEMRETLLHHTRGFAEELKELAKKLEAK